MAEGSVVIITHNLESVFYFRDFPQLKCHNNRPSIHCSGDACAVAMRVQWRCVCSGDACAGDACAVAMRVQWRCVCSGDACAVRCVCRASTLCAWGQ